jgi:hypothetical protein
MIYYAHGDALISSEDLQDDPSLVEKLSSFYKDLDSGRQPAPLAFESGELTPANALTSFDVAAAGDPPDPIVISVDGAPMEELANFAPTAASAAVLSRFFGIKDGQQLPLDTIIDAIKLFNDLKFRKEIDRLDDQLKALKPDDPKRPQLEEKRKALLGNIMEDLLKPK